MIFCVRPARLVPFCRTTTNCFLCLRGPGQAKKMKVSGQPTRLRYIRYQITTSPSILNAISPEEFHLIHYVDQLIVRNGSYFDH